MTAKSSPKAYGSIAVSLHWITVALITLLLATGMIADDANDVGRKATILSFHAPFGITVLLVTLVRLVWWWRFDTKPKPLGGDPAWQETLAKAVHILLYVVILGMAASGIGMFVLSGAGDILFGGAPGSLPDFDKFAPRVPHGIGAKILLVLIVGHVGAALFHHFVKRERILGRMWFARR